MRRQVRAGSPEEARLARYERLRQRLPLPRVDVRAGEGELLVTFEPSGPALSRPDAALAARAIAWLAALERAWGEPLGSALHDGELCFDAERALFVVGPGLLWPAGSRATLARLGEAVGVEAGALLSYGELAAVASAQRPELAPLLAVQASAEDSLRHLQELAERTSGADAVRYAQWALAIRPRDPALAERLTRLWLEEGRPGEPPGVRAVLEDAASQRAGSAVLLARLARQRGETSEARQWAERAVALSPAHLEGWRLLARAAHAQGDLERVMEALSALARAGDEAALGQLVAQQRWTLVDEALERWPGPFSPPVLRWRLERLYRREQLKALVLTFLEHLDAVQGAVQDSATCERVLEAATRLGTLGALRESLWRAIERGQAAPELVQFLARACRRSGVHAPVLILAERHPGALPPLWVAEALWEERRHEALLAYEPERAELAPLRLEAMLQLELASPDRFSSCAWEAAARAALASPSGEATLRACLERLRTHAPTFGPLPLLTQLSSQEAS